MRPRWSEPDSGDHPAGGSGKERVKMNTRDYRTASHTDLAGVIEIANIRRSFYTATYGTPDLLFGWLLTSARDAYEITSGGGNRQTETTASQSGLPAERYMAGLLLCDENFIPAHVLKSYDHHYHLDFLAGTLQLRTQLYAVAQRSASFFTIRIEGRIRESTFVVRHAVTERVLARISEEEVKKPNFFTQELPFLCFHTQQDPGLADAGAPGDLFDQSFELRLPVNLNGTVTTVLVCKEKGEQQGRVQDPETGEVLCPIPPHCFNNLGLLVETLPAMLIARKAQFFHE